MDRLKLMVLLVMVGCGNERIDGGFNTDLDEINNKIAALTLIAGSLDAVVNSDFASCPASGDTADPLIRKICLVAQAATVELQVQLQNQLANAVTALNGEIDAINSDLASNQANLALINAQLTTLLGDVALLDSRLDSAEAAIDALEALTASISGTLNGTMQTVVIGDTNVSAGPSYEILLRRSDKKRINGYVNAVSAPLSVINAGVDPTNGSAVVTVTTSTNHGLSIGHLVQLANIDEGSGFTSGDLYGEFVVGTVPTVTTFTITLPRLATSGNTFGGNVGVVQRVVGRGMASVWVSDQVSDVAVRQTSAGSLRYNFIIRRIASDISNDTAEICFSKADRSATFATINAAPENGNGTIACL